VSARSRGTEGSGKAAKGAAKALKCPICRKPRSEAFKPFFPLREELEKPFRNRVFFWPRKGGKEGVVDAKNERP